MKTPEAIGWCEANLWRKLTGSQCGSDKEINITMAWDLFGVTIQKIISDTMAATNNAASVVKICRSQPESWNL